MGKAKTMTEHVVAGGVSGIAARTCIAPIERLKIIYQLNSASQTNAFAPIVRSIFNEGGVMGLWKGNTPAVIRVAPYMSCTFLAYEEYKSMLSSLRDYPNLQNLVAGSLGGITAVCLTYPLDVVRARLAMQNEGLLKGKPYKGMIDALRKIPKEEGFRTLYRGLAPTCTGVGPYAGLKFGFYEALKTFMAKSQGIEKKELSAEYRVVSGAAAGAVAQTFVYPLDVVRRRMQTGVQNYRGLFHAIRTIAVNEGVTRGLYRGLSLNYLKTIPNVAIYMSLYDVIKRQLDLE